MTVMTGPPRSSPDAHDLQEREERQQGRRLRIGIIGLAILMVIAAGLILALPGLDQVRDELGRMSPWWVIAALALEVLSCIGYALAFQLVFARAPRLFAARVAFSEQAFGAVVPVGGAGGVAVGAWMLRERGVAWNRIAQRSTVLFLLTSAINVIALVPAGLAYAIWGRRDDHVLLGLVPAAVGVVVIAGGALLPRWTGAIHSERRSAVLLRGLIDAFGDTRQLLLRPQPRVVGAYLYFVCDVAVLGVCLVATGLRPDVSALVLGYLLGYLGNLIPVPGGVGVLDGGLLGGLALYGEPISHRTTAAVLVYHAIVLWVPTTIGTVAFIRARRTLHTPLRHRSTV